MSNEIKPVVVIGGGIIGLSIALSLQSKGVKVTLLERQEVGKGASWGNAGHLATEQVFPVADPSVLKSIPSMLLDPLGPLRLDWRYLHKITPWLLRLLANMRSAPYQKIHQALLRLNAQSLNTWENFAKTWDLSPWIKINGSLLVAEHESTALTLKKHGAYLKSIGVDNQWLSYDELHEREPALAETQIGGLFYPDTGHIVDLEAVIQQLLHQFQALGGDVIQACHVKAAHKVSEQSFTLQTSQGVMFCQQIIIATGAYSKELTKQLTGVSVPLETERGYHLMLPQEKNRLAIPVSSADRRFIMTPMNNGLRLAGTVEYAGLDLPANMKRAQNFIPLAQAMFKEPLQQDGAAEWMGFRPTISDSLPVIDKIGDVYLAFGHQHLGLTHAAITSQLITAMYFNEPTVIETSAYQLNRFK